MAKPDISVAIPTYQREEVLIDTIKALLKQSQPNLEVLVVDQSADHAPAVKKALNDFKKDERFRYFLVDPPSLPAARNFALNKALAPLILFLDDDIIPSPDLVKFHLLAFKEHPDVSAVGGRVMQDGFPIRKEVLRFDENAVSHGVFTATDGSYTNAFPGGNHSLKVIDALAVGGFDTRFFWNAFREESDMSMKMTRANLKIYYEPRAKILHLAAHSGGTRVKSYTHIYDSSHFYRNELFFTLRAAAPGHKLSALTIKYHEYCDVPGRRQKLRRSYYYLSGIIAALCRQLFGRQIIAVERNT